MTANRRRQLQAHERRLTKVHVTLGQIYRSADTRLLFIDRPPAHLATFLRETRKVRSAVGKVLRIIRRALAKGQR
jgi:hypothetical protein